MFCIQEPRSPTTTSLTATKEAVFIEETIPSQSSTVVVSSQLSTGSVPSQTPTGGIASQLSMYIVDSPSETFEIVYTKSMLKSISTDMEASTTVPSVSDSIKPSVLPIRSCFGAISRIYAQANTGYSSSVLESSGEEREVLSQEAETSQNLVWVCVCMKIT